ncbi:MFS general substrate transporter [Lentinula detonsa]|uniref:MFS general substrate transporter n=1 Tax=Lentinula detonsa TaxID=2804962 RepID=A0A9W8TYU4_9AGAR|nr:MFS general substrate transporter [Lentinula detonsa]
MTSTTMSILWSNAVYNLIPKREKTGRQKPLLKALLDLNARQWAEFWIGSQRILLFVFLFSDSPCYTRWLAWTCDSIDFYSVSLSVTNLSAQFGRDTTDITRAITLTLLLRSVGAILFGIISDRFGRKYPLAFNLLLVSCLELGAGFVQTYSQFLALRSLFGIAMGGIWGLAASTSLENLPVETRGLASGVLQEGYAAGCLIAAIINLCLVPEQPHSWRALFWCAAGISAFAAFIRLCLPESKVFLKARANAKIREELLGLETSSWGRTKIFLRETRKMLKRHWILCIYAVVFMSGFNFLSHGSQDLFPTYIQISKGFSAHDATLMTIIGLCGAIVGGAFAGSISQYIGRRLSLILFVLLGALFIPLWILPTSFAGLTAGAFCVQFGLQGSWGAMAIHLAEMSPPAFRATFPGVVYQVGNMVSSASAQIEATGGNDLKTTISVPVNSANPTGQKIVPNYGKVQGILIGCVAAFTIIVTIVGPENHGYEFEKHRAAFEEGGADDNAMMSEEMPDDVEVQKADTNNVSQEKATEEMVENVC